MIEILESIFMDVVEVEEDGDHLNSMESAEIVATTFPHHPEIFTPKGYLSCGQPLSFII